MLFSFPLFIVLLREALEISLITFILISFINKLPFLSSYKTLVYQGIGTGVGVILLVGIILVEMIKIFKIQTQDLWEVCLGLVSGIVIILTGLGFINSMRLYKKLEGILRDSISSNLDLTEEQTPLIQSASTGVDKQMFFYIPFVTVLREGMESILLISGVTVALPLESVPLSVVLGMIAGISISYVLHRLTDKLALKNLFTLGGFVMILMGVGIVSRSVGKFQDLQWGLAIGLDPDAVDTFDPRINVWYLPSWNENVNLYGGILNSVFGFRHTATTATIVTYCLTWGLVVLAIGVMKLKQGRKCRKEDEEVAGLVANMDNDQESVILGAAEE